MEIEIFPLQFLDGIGVGGDNICGVVWNSWLDIGPCGRDKRRIVTGAVHCVGGYDPPEVVITGNDIVWNSKYIGMRHSLR